MRLKFIYSLFIITLTALHASSFNSRVDTSSKHIMVIKTPDFFPLKPAKVVVVVYNCYPKQHCYDHSDNHHLDGNSPIESIVAPPPPLRLDTPTKKPFAFLQEKEPFAFLQEQEMLEREAILSAHFKGMAAIFTDRTDELLPFVKGEKPFYLKSKST